jgi:hypothetical protein
MKIAIVHYHLNRGGVTQVIANHLRSLAAVGNRESPVEEVALLFGGRKEGWSDNLPTPPRVTLQPVEGLDYDTGSIRPSDLHKRLSTTLDQIGFDRQSTVLHVHNHALGKNVALPGALRELAEDGYAQLLQIHDFAEDFRPDNYRALHDVLAPGDADALAQQLYFQADHIHYAALNDRDLGLLGQAGASAERLHLLPNPVDEPASSGQRSAARKALAQQLGVAPDARLIIYPVRGIRRKNLGEALLWSVLAGANCQVALTLAPLNPVEQPSYARWKQFAAERQLPFLFELGTATELRFRDIQASADLLLTTSVAEGFGMVFLETWLVDRPLIGRDLPEITASFVANGLRLSGCYTQLQTPIDWLDERQFRDGLLESYRSVIRRYGQPFPDQATLDNRFDRLVADGWVDFSHLASPLQQQVIDRLQSDSAAQARFADRNPWVQLASGQDIPSIEDVHHNAEVVRSCYGLQGSGRRLCELYAQVLSRGTAGPVTALPEAGSILRNFLDLARFHPVRVEK